jgi:hypothetical protein
VIVRGPVLVQHLMAWSNYEDDLRDYTIEIFAPDKDSEHDFYNDPKEPVLVKKAHITIDEPEVNTLTTQVDTQTEIWNK